MLIIFLASLVIGLSFLYFRLIPSILSKNEEKISFAFIICIVCFIICVISVGFLTGILKVIII